ncbi:MAG: cadmium-translocating P-type ATPase [Ruminococcaceae bacterium]|nr:cadmium-translocating P-type ATPase [Oscillospiraceae bacterium]
MKKKTKLNKGQRKRLLSIIIGAFFALLGIIFSFSELELLSSLSFIAAGVAAGVMCVTRAIRGIWSGNFFDENTLMTIAAVGAVCLGEYAECAAVMILYQVGELFQSIAVGRSRRAISALGALCPDFANLVEGDSERTVHPTELGIGDIIRIKAGERIPVDCTVIEGETSVDTSPVTGESVPRDATIGDTLYSGCINKSGLIEARVVATTDNSAAGRILALTETASERKTKSEAFITRFAKVYTPLVALLAAILAFLVPLMLQLFGAQTYLEAFPEWSRRALTMLVISCPCALVISVPLGYFCGLGNASKNAVLIKGSSFIDTLAKVECAAFDKTGTLTAGELSVVSVETEGEGDELLSLAAAAEENSSHPIARAIVAASEKKYTAKSVCELSGVGVTATLSDGREVKVIRPENKTDRTAVEVYVDGERKGIVYFEDKLKSDARASLANLKRLGVKKTVMLTGDNRETAKKVGHAVGIDSIEAELMPEDKFAKIEELSKEGTLMYVGDGINDSPSLARADVGVAMGALGSGAAIEAADVVLMSTDLSKIPYAVRLSKRTARTVKVNIVLSLTVKILVLILATLNVVGMWAAIVADVGVCIVAVSNSMRLLKSKPPVQPVVCSTPKRG